MPQSRQLAAIMFTDIVGYTALMGSDEQKAFEFLNKNRALQKPVIEQHNGHWIKELGDGVMASFNTVSDAVSAAVEIQQQCNAGKAFQLRIGVHLGEVVFENDDVFGDGVNIAARVQAIANPGGIFVTEAVHENLVNKRGLNTKYLRTVSLKNVKEPVKLFQVIAEGVAAENNTRLTRKLQKNRFALWIAGMAMLALIVTYILNKRISSAVEGSIFEKSIAILPFTDMSPGKDQEYLSDGLADEIINSITIIKDLKVIGRTSSFQFKDKGLDARTIGQKLKVNIILEGSIQKSGDILRIITKLISVKGDSTIWSQRFDKPAKDIFAVQDTIAGKIIENLRITLSNSERPRLKKKETDPDVYSLYLKGLYTYKASDFDKAIEYNTQALAKDSTFAPSLAYLALSKMWKINLSGAYLDANAIREAKEYALRSMRLDPDLAESYSALALMAWTIELDFASAKENFEKSLALSPSSSLNKNRYAYFLLWMGEFDKAEKLGLEAINADPADWNGYVIVAYANLYKKKFSRAENYIAEGQKLFPGREAIRNLRIEAKFYAGKYDEVIALSQQLSSGNLKGFAADLAGMRAISYERTNHHAEAEKLLQELASTAQGLSNNFFYTRARVFASMKRDDSCFANLERSYQQREPAFRTLKIDPILEPLRKDPRFADLYHRYGFDRYR